MEAEFCHQFSASKVFELFAAVALVLSSDICQTFLFMLQGLGIVRRAALSTASDNLLLTACLLCVFSSEQQQLFQKSTCLFYKDCLVQCIQNVNAFSDIRLSTRNLHRFLHYSLYH